MSDLRTQLGDYFDSVVERVDVTDVVERSTTSIGPGPDFGVGRGAEPTAPVEAARPRLPVLLTAAAVAVLVVVAIVVLTSRSDSDTQIIDQPPTAVSLPSTVTSTTVAPEPFVGEVPTVDVAYPTELLGTALTPSPIGDFRWTLLSGDRAVLPNNIVETPTGFASVNGLLLLESADGSEWEAVAPPVPGLLAGLTVDEAGTYVLRTVPRLNTRLSVPWESTDFVNWTPAAASEPLSLRQLISGPGILSGELTELVTTAEGATFSEGKFWIDWGSVALLLGGDDLQQRIDEGMIFDGPRFDPGSGVVDFDLYENRDDRFAGTNPLPSGVRVGASITGTVDDWTVELENIEDGATIGTVTGSIGGMPVDEVLETLAGGGVLSGFYLVSGDDVEPVEPPWFDVFGADDFRLFARIDDVLFAYIGARVATSSPMEVWRSPNGRTWESLGPTSFSTPPLPLRERDGVLVAQFENGQGAEYSYLRSVDGISWSPPTRPPEAIFDSSSASLLAVDAGWILVDRHVPDPDRLTFEFDPRPSIWTSLDGDVWEQLDTSEWPHEMPPELAELPAGIGSFLTRSSNEHAYSGISQTDPSTPAIVAIVEWN